MFGRIQTSQNRRSYSVTSSYKVSECAMERVCSHFPSTKFTFAVVNDLKVDVVYDLPMI